MFRRLLQAHVALADSLNRCVDEAGLDARSADRARFVVSLFVDALAPTNFLAGNPAALRKLADTKGVSVIRGFANFVEDLASGRGLPRQVDARPFTVGKNVAATPGAVVFRNELLELIQYAPTTPDVHARPLLIVPPQINKFYVFDLAPSNSLVRWSLESGVQTFVASWRNPTREHAECGLDAYVEALEQAVDAMREVSGSADVNVFGACSGGITLTALLAWLAAVGRRKVKSATLAVCVLDTAAARDTTAGLFVTPATIAAARAASRKRGVLEGSELARMFAWMRPNDLVWNYVVNNYLLGNDPPAHDILFWNSDTTRLPARLHADFLALFEANPFPRPDALRVRRRKVDVAKIGIDTYVDRRPHRPHHAVAGRLPDGAALRRRAQHVRPLERRSHPEPRQPARERALVVHGGPRARRERRILARSAAEERRQLVAALARVDQGAVRPDEARAGIARQRPSSGDRRGPRHLRARAMTARRTTLARIAGHAIRPCPHPRSSDPLCRPERRPGQSRRCSSSTASAPTSS